MDKCLYSNYLVMTVYQFSLSSPKNLFALCMFSSMLNTGAADERVGVRSMAAAATVVLVVVWNGIRCGRGSGQGDG